jgi:hypothetical protein
VSHEPLEAANVGSDLDDERRDIAMVVDPTAGLAEGSGPRHDDSRSD